MVNADFLTLPIKIPTIRTLFITFSLIIMINKDIALFLIHIVFSAINGGISLFYLRLYAAQHQQALFIFDCDLMHLAVKVLYLLLYFVLFPKKFYVVKILLLLLWPVSGGSPNIFCVKILLRLCSIIYQHSIIILALVKVLSPLEGYFWYLVVWI